MTTIAHGIVMISLGCKRAHFTCAIWYLMSSADYLPVYFQATLGAGPIESAVKGLPASIIIAPFALLAGLSVHFIHKYRPTILVGWCLLISGFGIMSLMRAGDSTAQWVGYQIVGAAGIGILVSTSGYIRSRGLNADMQV